MTWGRMRRCLLSKRERRKIETLVRRSAKIQQAHAVVFTENTAAPDELVITAAMVLSCMLFDGHLRRLLAQDTAYRTAYLAGQEAIGQFWEASRWKMTPCCPCYREAT